MPHTHVSSRMADHSPKFKIIGLITPLECNNYDFRESQQQILLPNVQVLLPTTHTSPRCTYVLIKGGLIFFCQMYIMHLVLGEESRASLWCGFSSFLDWSNLIAGDKRLHEGL